MFLTVRQRNLRVKRNQPVPFALKLQTFLGHQDRCLRHFPVLGKKFWKVPGGSGVEVRPDGNQYRVLDRIARSPATMVYGKQPSLWSHMGLGGIEDLG